MRSATSLPFGRTAAMPDQSPAGSMPGLASLPASTAILASPSSAHGVQHTSPGSHPISYEPAFHPIGWGPPTDHTTTANSSGCPVMRASTTAGSAAFPPPQMSTSPSFATSDARGSTFGNGSEPEGGADPVSEWRETLEPGVRRMFESLRYDLDKMDGNIKQAENEIFRKEEEAFFVRQDEIEHAQLIKRQQDELLRTEAQFRSMLEERKGRKYTKRLQKHMAKEAKMRDARIRQQDTAKNLAAEVREALSQHRKRFEHLIVHIEGKQRRQHEQLLISQERKAKAQKALLDLEARGQHHELIEDIVKDFQYRQNHQSSVDKTIVDQQHDAHQMELKHRKERFDAEAKALENMASLRAQHLRKTNE
ncbi:hypothetical protein BC828DRAFT_417634, partial [Blastocladiella britannica]